MYDGLTLGKSQQESYAMNKPIIVGKMSQPKSNCHLVLHRFSSGLKLGVAKKFHGMSGKAYNLDLWVYQGSRGKL